MLKLGINRVVTTWDGGQDAHHTCLWLSVVAVLLAAVALCLCVAKPAAAHSWKEIFPIGSLPEPRELGSAVYDSKSNRLILYGGLETDFWTGDDVWILTNANGLGNDKTTWIRVPTDSSLTRARHSSFYNPTTNRMIVFGGAEYFPGDPNAEAWVLTNANAVSGTAHWQQLVPASGPKPAPRADQAGVYDVRTNRMVIFGGAGNGLFFNDTWVLTNADGTETKRPTWIPLAVTGTLPAKRDSMGAVYDPTTNRMLIFGGERNGAFFNDVWVLSNATGVEATPPHWVKKNPSGVAPASRMSWAGGYNPTTNRLVVFGGTNTSTAYRDTWLLIDPFGTAPRWVKRSPVGVAPPPLSQMATVYIHSRDRLVIVAGDLDPNCCLYSNSTYALDWATQ